MRYDKRWQDCREAGRDHGLILVQTTAEANYYGCPECPVVYRKVVHRDGNPEEELHEQGP